MLPWGILPIAAWRKIGEFARCNCMRSVLTSQASYSACVEEPMICHDRTRQASGNADFGPIEEGAAFAEAIGDEAATLGVPRSSGRVGPSAQKPATQRTAPCSM